MFGTGAIATAFLAMALGIVACACSSCIAVYHAFVSPNVRVTSLILAAALAAALVGWRRCVNKNRRYGPWGTL